MYGWMGKVLRVDLSNGKVFEEDLDPRIARLFVGGRGLGIERMLREVDPACDPLSPQNVLIMATGALTATKAPTGGRYMVMTKSPLTGSVTCSNSGGHFPAELKRAGVDMIVFQGKSPEPVYLWIEPGRAELRPAGHIWGKNTHKTDATIKSETAEGARVACIGPAGERGVLYASIMNDKDRAAGRSGVGAVMGSKNLKGVAALGGTDVPLFDAKGFGELVKGINKRFRENLKGAKHPLNVYGTAVTVMATQNFGVFPTRNFQQGTFEGWEELHGENLTRKYLVRAKACFNCPIGCGRVTKVEDPEFAGQGEGPEYETLYAMGSNCGIGNLAAVTKANYICNEMGMDTISYGSTLACAMELSERGHLPEADSGGKLRFGDVKSLVDFAYKTALREGFGDILAIGSHRMAEKYGHPELAMVAKKQEFAGYDPRGEQGMGLAYATSPVGASHMRGDPAYIELLGVPMLLDPLSCEGKAQLIKDWQNTFAIIDAAGLCVFFSVRNLVTPTRDILPQGIMELLNHATGAAYDLNEFVQCGERIFNAERLFMVRAGISAKDDTLPPRMLKEPLPDGPARGHVCRLPEMLQDYYRLRGWDKEGVPSREKLEELGLIQDSRNLQLG